MTVNNGPELDARMVAKVVGSSLVKTAMFGKDQTSRIIAAIGAVM